MHIMDVNWFYPDHARTVTWCKQIVDKVINGKIVSKSRELNEALINPRTNLIQSVGVGSTMVFAESVIPFFNPDDEIRLLRMFKQSVLSRNNIVAAVATAVVLLQIQENDHNWHGGTGYTSAPSVTIETL